VTWLDLVALLGAGGLAGLINTVVGSGTLITFPTLLALGVPPVTANISNTVGLAPGSLSGAWATGHELNGERRRVLWLGSASLLGGIGGAFLLLWLPSPAFDAIVPVLIGLGCVLVILQPLITKRLAHRRARLGLEAGPPLGAGLGSVLLWLAIALTGVYGGYFGAAQGVLLIAILGIGLAESLARVNAIKNVLATIVNTIAGVVFVIVSEVNWPAAIAIAVGSVLGAQVGGRVGRKLPATTYRVIIVAVGVAAIVSLVT
jgi:uncharacterized membrane protein YfcA